MMMRLQLIYSLYTRAWTSYGSAKITLIAVAARKLHIKAQIKTLQKHNCVNMKAPKNCKS